MKKYKKRLNKILQQIRISKIYLTVDDIHIDRAFYLNKIYILNYNKLIIGNRIIKHRLLINFIILDFELPIKIANIRL